MNAKEITKCLEEQGPYLNSGLKITGPGKGSGVWITEKWDHEEQCWQPGGGIHSRDLSSGNWDWSLGVAVKAFERVEHGRVCRLVRVYVEALQIPGQYKITSRSYARNPNRDHAVWVTRVVDLNRIWLGSAFQDAPNITAEVELRLNDLQEVHRVSKDVWVPPVPAVQRPDYFNEEWWSLGHQAVLDEVAQQADNKRRRNEAETLLRKYLEGQSGNGWSVQDSKTIHQVLGTLEGQDALDQANAFIEAAQRESQRG